MKRVQVTREPMHYGRVLIVDDVETNIYVAKGLMTPYKLKMDAAESGYAAIEKIKDGNVYDIIFMDHMMPQMDGIETTQKLRGMGYTEPIVALTANAVSGQAEIFLGNGFDDFISKPIDVRQLNTVLNKLVRDKQPLEVLDSARRQAEEAKGQAAEQEAQPDIDPDFAEIFLRDAKKALATLGSIHEKGDYGSEDDLRTYIINVHGMKSALANIKEMELSAVALKLEMAGREGKLEMIVDETPVFLSSLQSFVDKLSSASQDDGDDSPDSDPSLLTEKLLAIKAACEEYDEDAAEDVVAELREKHWSKDTKALLDFVSENLLHSDFDEVISAVNERLGV